MNRKEQTMLVATGLTLATALLKFFLAGISGSLALQASAYHILLATLVSAMVLIGIALSRFEGKGLVKGAGFVENAVAFLVALFIFYAAYDLGSEAIAGEVTELSNLGWVFVGSLFSSVLVYVTARYKGYVGEQTESPALVADASHSLTHLYAEIAVLVGILGSAVGMSSLDRLAAIFVLGFVFVRGVAIFTTSVRGLSGNLEASVSPERFLLFRGQLRWANWLALGLLTAIYISTVFYSVGWNQVGFVLRFGVVVQKEVPPGLHLKLPYPFESVDRVDVGSIRKVRLPSELLLTGDENLASLSATVHYDIKSPWDYRFRQQKPDQLVLVESESGLRRLVSQRRLDYVLAEGKGPLQSQAKAIIQASLDSLKSGVRLLNINLTVVRPPEAVVKAFYDVQDAREDQVTFINTAQAYANERIPAARADFARQVAEAEGMKAKRINQAKGEGTRFVQKLAEYQKAPEVTRYRILLESLERILPGRDKVILDGSNEMPVTDLWFFDGTKADGEGK